MSEQLKPCPFCGGEASLVRNDPEVKGDLFDVVCRSTGCFLQYGAEWCLPKAEVVKRWNARQESE